MTPTHKLSPWPVRLIAYAVLVLIAILSIRVIDRHVMARADQTQPKAAVSP